jgi:penicillin-binding protein 1A
VTPPPLPESARAARRRRPVSLRWRIATAAMVALLALVGAAVFAAAATWARHSVGLPDLPTLAEYHPPVVTEIVSGDGQLVGELFVERRKVVPYSRIPKQLVQAFIASEDQNFFEHGGVDVVGTARAALNTYVLRRKVQGGSTITQQTAKSLLVSAEGFAEGTRRDLRRKIRELILARRLEKAFSKEEILFLYLNGVYLGHHSYGIQSASENYFRKNADDLTLAEAALLAGLPQAPSRYSPFSNPDAAKMRRRYVLRRMSEEGMISEAERRDAEAAKVNVFGVDDVFREIAPFYAEHARRVSVERYGTDRLLTDGLRIETAMDLEMQRAAQAAMLAGLMEVDHRQGFYGPITNEKGKEREALQAKLAKAWPKGALQPDDYAVGIVQAVDDGGAIARVQVGATAGILPISGMRWARKPNPNVSYADAQITKPSAALRVGDVILVRRVTRRELVERERAAGRKGDVPEAPVLLSLEQDPKLQGALVSLDPWSGYVTAMVGGYDFEASEFNRAFQACRQPGSAFKPIVYAAAIDQLGWHASTLLTDAPIVYRDAESGTSWKPENFAQEFRGDVTLRDAVVHSMNIPAVKTAQALGLEQLVAFAKTVGLSTPVKHELGSALGSSCTTLWELSNVYAVLDRYGEKRPALFVKRVLDRSGRVLEDRVASNDPWVPIGERLAAAGAEVRTERERVMDERSAHMTVHLLHEVATVGTGAQAARLGKPAAGKTGTTNDSFDTWFMGFTRDLVAGVWLGYDHNETPLGRYETGGRASLPIWIDFMQGALRERPQPEFPVPDGIVMVNIDPRSGEPLEEGGVPEPFKIENPPVARATEGRSVEVRDLFGE